MEVIKKLITRFWPMGTLFLTGLIVIIYVAFGFLYLQQGAQQRELEGRIAKLSLVVARPLPSSEKLQAEYEDVNRLLALVTTDTEAIAKLVGVAQRSGIDLDEESGKFSVPKAMFSQAKVGGGSYQVLSFRNIQVQGDYDNIMAFISVLDSGEIVLDSGETLKTMVLKRVATSEVEVMFVGEEGDRRAEFRSVASAVMDMMDNNALLRIPNPMNFASGAAANLTGDDPATEEVVEGFPDITTTAIDKGYTGNATPRVGYVLYNHDKISTDNATQFETVSYITVLTTKYYYTCEADGTVRQFDGARVVRATEYLGSAASKIEIVTNVDVDIYTKPEE